MNYIHKISVLLIFTLLPIADTFGGLTNDFMPLSLLGRLCVLALALPIIINCRRLFTEILPPLYLTFSYFLIATLVQLLVSDTLDYGLLAISNAIKIMYFPVLLATIIVLSEKNIISTSTISHGILLTGILVIISIILGRVSGLGTDIAGRGTDISGNRGFMIGANEVGLMLLLTAPSVIIWIGGLKVLYKIKNFIALAIYCVSAIIVLTKSSIASILIPIANWLLHSGKNCASSGLLISVKLTSLSVLLIVLLIAYDNEIETILGKTFLSSLIDGNMLGFIFRGRSDYYEAILPGLINHEFNSIIILFGAGEGLIRSLSMAPLGRSASDATMFEMDALDLFWAYGWIGFFLYLALIYYLIRKAKLSKLTPLHSFAIALTLIHSVLAGHVIFSPQVSTLIAFTLMLYSKRLARSTENT